MLVVTLYGWLFSVVARGFRGLSLLPFAFAITGFGWCVKCEAHAPCAKQKGLGLIFAIILIGICLAKKGYLVFLIQLLLFPIGYAQSLAEKDSVCFFGSDSLVSLRRKPLLATSEIVGINGLVWGFNYFVMNEPFSQINYHTMYRNLRTWPVWDTDKFSTNLVAHPYHGSLYFNAARSNGMTFWESVPFTVGGSLMWEYFMENELPSCNDLFSTTFGGVALGEMMFRLSDLVLDNRQTGFQRVVREVAGGVISPVRGINRLVSGDAWRYSASRGRVFANNDLDFTLFVGPRYLMEQEQSKDGEISANIGFNLAYGDLFESKSFKPYDYFRLKASFDLLSNQPFCSQVGALGLLWGKPVWSKGSRSLATGLFHHFTYYDSQVKLKNGELMSPYRMAEAAALGGGLIYENTPHSNSKIDVKHELYVNCVLLGASLTDYFFVDERDYNLGSGYSLKSYTQLLYKQWAFMINLENYHIYTWKGYDPDLDLSEIDFTTLNVQGDLGDTRLGVFSLKLIYHLNNQWCVRLSNNHYSRYTRYKYHNHVAFATSDVFLSFGLKL